LKQSLLPLSVPAILIAHAGFWVKTYAYAAYSPTIAQDSQKVFRSLVSIFLYIVAPIFQILELLFIVPTSMNNMALYVFGLFAMIFTN